VIPRSDLPQVEQLWVGDELTPNGSENDGGGELTVYPFAHYSLKAHRRRHETEANKRDGVGPGGFDSAGSYASLTRLPDGDGCSHRERRLYHCSYSRSKQAGGMDREFDVGDVEWNAERCCCCCCFESGRAGSEEEFRSEHPREQEYEFWSEQKVEFRFRTQKGYVPVKSHVRVLEPILSPSRPIAAPPKKLTREHNACWSAMRNVVSPGVSHNLASARAS